jgi:hypothetical protein
MAGDPVLHPEDRPDHAERHAGPWLALLAGAVVGWTALVAVDRTLLVDGTALWATVRSLHTLILAPVAAAALYQDTRALDGTGVDFGRLRFAYALCALVVPPSAVVYGLDRWRRTRSVE